MDQLRQELMQSYFNQMSGAMSDVSPEHLQRMKDMFNGLNQLLEMRERGDDTAAAVRASSWSSSATSSPATPQTLDELLEQMAQQMAAMQNLLNSMTPEQRAQLQGLAEALLEDMDLRWQVDRLGANLRQAFPQRRMGPAGRTSSGQDPLGFAEAAGLMNQLGDMDQLENLLSPANSPGALADVDIERAREILGDDGGPLARAPGRADQARWRRPA